MVVRMQLAGFIGMVLRVNGVADRGVTMLASVVMLAVDVRLGGSAMVLRSLFMMVCRGFMMLGHLRCVLHGFVLWMVSRSTENARSVVSK
jgi:hypothetical protein